MPLNADTYTKKEDGAPYPFFLFACIVFWGYFSGCTVISILIGISAEAFRIFPKRLSVNEGDIRRMTVLSILFFVMLVIYTFLEFNDLYEGIRILHIFSPLCGLPLLFLQLYGDQKAFSADAVFFSISKIHLFRNWEFNTAYPFAAFFVIAAGRSPVDPAENPLITTHSSDSVSLYYIFSAVLIAAGLATVKPGRKKRLSWLMLLIVCTIVGYGAHMGMDALRVYVEKKGWELLSGYIDKETNPYKSITAIGDIGVLKQSGRILYRVKTGKGVRLPLLIREASYNHFKFSNWYAVDSHFKTITPQSLQPHETARPVFSISHPLFRKNGLLKTVGGFTGVTGLPAETDLVLSANSLGAIRLKNTPELLNYTIYGGNSNRSPVFFDTPPDEPDLNLNNEERRTLKKILTEAGVNAGGEMSPEEKIRAVRRYFAENYAYSLTLENGDISADPLEYFFTTSRKGHCEYFASAAVLLLRAAGIPARYAVGYAVYEYSELEKAYLVRSRNAHSWALAYYDGKWRNVDATPPLRAESEAGKNGIWRLIPDFFSYLSFSYLKWKEKSDKNLLTEYAEWFFIPVVIFLLVRAFSGKRFASEAIHENTSDSPINKEIHPFSRVEKQMSLFFRKKRPGETTACWIKAVSHSYPDAFSPEQMKKATALFYRYKYDTKPLNIKDMEELSRLITFLESEINAYISHERGRF